MTKRFISYKILKIYLNLSILLELIKQIKIYLKNMVFNFYKSILETKCFVGRTNFESGSSDKLGKQNLSLPMPSALHNKTINIEVAIV